MDSTQTGPGSASHEVAEPQSSSSEPALPASVETLKSVEPSSSMVLQGPTLEVPPVDQRAESPLDNTPLARTASSDSKVATAEVHSPVPPDKTSQQNTDKLHILAEKDVPPPYAADTTVTGNVDPSPNDNALLLGKCNPQQESTVTETAETVVTVKNPDENVKTDNSVKMTDAGNETKEDVIAPHSPGHRFVLVQGIPNETIDHSRSKDRLLLSKVGSSVKQRWSMLARHLGLLEEDVQDIKETCDTSEGRGMEVVLRWLQKTRNPTGE